MPSRDHLISPIVLNTRQPYGNFWLTIRKQFGPYALCSVRCRPIWSVRKRAASHLEGERGTRSVPADEVIASPFRVPPFRVSRIEQFRTGRAKQGRGRAKQGRGRAKQ